MAFLQQVRIKQKLENITGEEEQRPTYSKQKNSEEKVQKKNSFAKLNPVKKYFLDMKSKKYHILKLQC